jgi:hypothetical protein
MVMMAEAMIGWNVHQPQVLLVMMAEEMIGWNGLYQPPVLMVMMAEVMIALAAQSRRGVGVNGAPWAKL